MLATVCSLKYLFNFNIGFPPFYQKTWRIRVNCQFIHNRQMYVVCSFLAFIFLLLFCFEIGLNVTSAILKNLFVAKDDLQLRSTATSSFRAEI